MKINGSSNTAAVLHDYLQKAGIWLTSDGLATLTGTFCDRLQADDGVVTFIDDAGVKQELFAHVAELHQSHDQRSYFDPEGPLYADLVSNPWAKGRENITRQMALKKRHPELAERVRQLAAGSSTATGGDPSNPFCKKGGGFNITAQMQLFKSDPDKARFLKAQALQ